MYEIALGKIFHEKGDDLGPNCQGIRCRCRSKSLVSVGPSIDDGRGDGREGQTMMQTCADPMQVRCRRDGRWRCRRGTDDADVNADEGYRKCLWAERFSYGS